MEVLNLLELVFHQVEIDSITQWVHMTILSSSRIAGINNILSSKWPKAGIMVTKIWLDMSFRIFKRNYFPPSLLPSLLFRNAYQYNSVFSLMESPLSHQSVRKAREGGRGRLSKGEKALKCCLFMSGQTGSGSSP